MGSGAARWLRYEEAESSLIERAHRRGQAAVDLTLGPHKWVYVIDLRRKVQRNPKTGTEREIRRSPAGKGGAVVWEVQASDPSSASSPWKPYEDDVNTRIERGFQAKQPTVDVWIGASARGP